jgi:hypothetical protein
MCRIGPPCDARVGACTARAAPLCPVVGGPGSWFEHRIPRPAHPSFGPRGLLLRAFGTRKWPEVCRKGPPCDARFEHTPQGGLLSFPPPCYLRAGLLSVYPARVLVFKARRWLLKDLHVASGGGVMRSPVRGRVAYTEIECGPGSKVNRCADPHVLPSYSPLYGGAPSTPP